MILKVNLQTKIYTVQEPNLEALGLFDQSRISRQTTQYISSAWLRLADDHEGESYNNSQQKSHKIQSIGIITGRATVLPHQIYRAKKPVSFPKKKKKSLKIEPLEPFPLVNIKCLKSSLCVKSL